MTIYELAHFLGKIILPAFIIWLIIRKARKKHKEMKEKLKGYKERK